MNNISEIIFESHKGDIPTKYAGLTRKEREDNIRQLIFREIGVESYDSKTFRRAMRENEAKVFNIIEDLIDAVLADGEWTEDAFIQEFVEVKNLALGDKNEFYVEGKNALEVVEFSGNHYDLPRRRVDVGQAFQVDVKDFGIRVYEEFERVASGRSDSGKLIVFAQEAVGKKLKDLAKTTFAAAVENIPTVNKVTGSYNEKKILDMLAHVEAENGTKPQLVAPATTLRRLQNVKDLSVSDGMANTLNNNLYLPVWNGYKCVELKQGHKIGTLDFVMPDNVIYAISPDTKLVKMVLEGETRVKDVADYQENADLTIEHALSFKAGCAVAYAGVIGTITLS